MDKSNTTSKTKETEQKPLLYRLGIGLIIASLCVWLIPIATPFTSLPTQVKASIIAGSIIVAELMFWVGGLMVGKEVIAGIKKRFNPSKWWKERSKKT